LQHFYKVLLGLLASPQQNGSSEWAVQPHAAMPQPQQDDFRRFQKYLQVSSNETLKRDKETINTLLEILYVPQLFTAHTDLHYQLVMIIFELCNGAKWNMMQHFQPLMQMAEMVLDTLLLLPSPRTVGGLYDLRPIQAVWLLVPFPSDRVAKKAAYYIRREIEMGLSDPKLKDTSIFLVNNTFNGEWPMQQMHLKRPSVVALIFDAIARLLTASRDAKFHSNAVSLPRALSAIFLNYYQAIRDLCSDPVLWFKQLIPKAKKYLQIQLYVDDDMIIEHEPLPGFYKIIEEALGMSQTTPRRTLITRTL
jgi:hypothetical protein